MNPAQLTCVKRKATLIAWNCSTFQKTTRVAVLFIFQGVTSGRNDNPLIPGNFEDEVSVALAAFVFCGGLTAFSAVFWALCTKLDPTLNETEMRQLFHYCAALFVRFSRTSFSTIVERLLHEWCAKEAGSDGGLVAGYYAMFAAAAEPCKPSARALYTEFSVHATGLISLLRRRGSAELAERALKYPYGWCDAYPVQETWLFKYLQAARKLGCPEHLVCVTRSFNKIGDDIPWVKDGVRSFEEQAALKQINKPVSRCALPGCGVTSTLHCPLRKCGRCLFVYYCSSQHQHSHWHTHKADCVKAPPADCTNAAVGAVVVQSSTDPAPQAGTYS
jgi:hypothetical protein